MTLATNKTRASATRTKFIANVGVIARVWIHFPPGCASLVKVRIYHQGHPFLPLPYQFYAAQDILFSLCLQAGQAPQFMVARHLFQLPNVIYLRAFVKKFDCLWTQPGNGQ